MNEPRMVAIVSGASRGIGAGAARALAGRGYHLIVNYLRNDAAAKEVVRQIEAAGGSAEVAQASVCDGDRVAVLVEQVHRDHGRVDVLVCNANTVHPPFEQLDTLTWDAFASKLAGAFFLTKEVLAIMREQRSAGSCTSRASTPTSPLEASHTPRRSPRSIRSAATQQGMRPDSGSR
ncbi:SDR family NAD(P)-dependent oxidoreductase [Nocardia sp. NBC_00508]|uniref:SDR family NAD(P)-dependent oxidoreductase n=1 Tax=Nocardia sp. NBC_00508 TaxID=2975992 RepID=UPI002E82266E|nr:SDR family NAD(P)-dependent oxidoreductase [Nocardia sp. NBC_00508]WUD65908.1 SDR family NAD(P)-dependent oxidoreductase [Nocardia sp. NBC_00508]